MAEQRTILIVEDSRSLAHTCKLQLEAVGHLMLMAETGTEALDLLRTDTIDCVLLDLNLPDMDGMEILREMRQWPQAPATVVTTANAALTVAVEAVRLGAFDYLVKPFAGARLVTTVTNALSNVELKREVETFRRTVEHAGFADFIGRSLPMQRVYRTIEAAARSSASVFITGESGTGKELAAHALHSHSPRATRQFVALNCGAIPRDLLESTIFGHVKGAFTGATADQDGAAARADGGTLFLDELGEMEMGLQTKLLRFIQTGTYERVGEGRSRHADIRFIAATNRDPLEAVREGRLREDLFYRLFVVPIAMPPLRDRGEDILLIARRFLEEFARAEGKEFKALTPEVEARLLAYSWPGNVRQLQNVIRNAVVLNDGSVIAEAMLPALPEPDQRGTPRPPMNGSMNGHAHPPVSADLPETSEAIVPLAEMERLYIERAIGLHDGNIQLAARRLGISPSTIYRKKEGWT
ncbi:MAG TPA: sigma-54 dependent transcriptional regulator [Alphaproteobacteria bacterium]|jgi:two-component system repressor protein LuxO|nr:sigma-54 dependent transcriptional regulator [Alphaproteobacteria bacterium]